MKVKLDEKAMPQGSQQVSQDLTQSYSALASTERQQLAYIAVDSNRQTATLADVMAGGGSVLASSSPAVAKEGKLTMASEEIDYELDSAGEFVGMAHSSRDLVDQLKQEATEHRSPNQASQEDSIFRNNYEYDSTLKFNDSIMSATKLLGYTDKDIETMQKYKQYAPKVELNKIVRARQMLKYQQSVREDAVEHEKKSKYMSKSSRRAMQHMEKAEKNRQLYGVGASRQSKISTQRDQRRLRLPMLDVDAMER